MISFSIEKPYIINNNLYVAFKFEKMYQDLKAHINKQNLKKLKKDNRYKIQEQESPQQSLDDMLDNFQLNQRVEAYEKNVNQQDQPRNSFHFQYFSDGKHNRLNRELELMQEKMRVAENCHQQEVKYLVDRYEGELEALQIKISSQNFMIERGKKDDSIISNLRKQNRQLIELKENSDQIADRKSYEIGQLKTQINRLQLEVRKMTEQRQLIQVQKHLENNLQKKLKQKTIQLEKELLRQKQKKKQMENYCEKIKRQNSEIQQQLDIMIIAQKSTVEETRESFKDELQKLQSQLAHLKKRNIQLQFSFITHLTQTSTNIQNFYHQKNEKSSSNQMNTTLNLHEQSPIRQKHNSKREEQEDPQKKENRPRRQCRSCSKKIPKMRETLEIANSKIMELLKWKGSHASKSFYY